ncbi:MAG TPA: hypothetical protein VNC21_03375 [Vicinamibacterales bacterium]|jgi:hypothetical protein|nr:hypothetical protein [Vicinamibacterales bacterium]
MIHPRRLLTALALTLTAATPALAGPPLLCHPFDIGTAKSLPWSDDGGWSRGRADYPIKQLVADTEAILQPGTPVIVRMETLRRAAIYASQDPTVAVALADRLTAKARANSTDPLAPLDAAYLIGALHQITTLGRDSEFRDRVDGVKRVVDGRDPAPFLTQAVQARPSDPAVAFAAALIALDTDRQAYDGYAARAKAGASQDTLLARNIKHLS